jgi:hypothetical protein
LASIAPYLFISFFWQESFWCFIETTIISVISAVLSIFYIGCCKQERAMIINYGTKLLRKLT